MAHPPAWYRDPKDPARVRRWDGQAWTQDVRPVPDWLRTLQLSAGPAAVTARRGGRRPGAAPRRTSSRALWATSAALLALGGLLMAFLANADDDAADADRLADRSFARVADARCAATGASLDASTRKHVEGVAEAERIERVTAAWDGTGTELRTLPVAPADARRVDRWLRTWDRWVALGYDYADALRDGDDADARAVLAEAAAPKAALRHFALVNRMDDCAFG